MLTLYDLGLTHLQMQEVAAADAELVEAWLQAAAAPKIKSPVGYFLSGVRSGDMPLARNHDARRVAVQLAETWIRNAGVYVPTETEVISELFEHGSSHLRPWYDDEDLRAQMIDVWRHERPRGERAERERDERAARYRAAREARTE